MMMVSRLKCFLLSSEVFKEVQTFPRSDRYKTIAVAHLQIVLGLLGVVVMGII
jgi:hypothetical protein